MFKINEVVTPKPGYLGNGYRFIIFEEFLEPQINPMYKLEYIGDTLNPIFGSIPEQEKIIKQVESVRWLENEIDYAYKYALKHVSLQGESYQPYEPTPDKPAEIRNETKISCENKNLFDGAKILDNCITLRSDSVQAYHDLVNTRIEIDSGPSILTTSAIQEYYNNLCEKEKNEMEILNLYKDRKLDALNEEYANKKLEIKEKDEIQSVITEMQKQVMTILENDGQEIHHDLGTFNLYTKETQKKLKELENKQYDAKKEVNKTIEEIKALFQMTEDYSERIKILKNYKILNKDGKLSI